MGTNKSKCDCAVCKDEHDFEMSHDLLQDFMHGKVAIFAGSGISTESRNVLEFTFYEDIAAEIDKLNSYLSFPELMEKYCQLPNGRIKLLRIGTLTLKIIVMQRLLCQMKTLRFGIILEGKF
jgi:hypothetical protein